MKILILPDSFKGSLKAAEAADAIAEGMYSNYPEAELIRKPVADGGEGTVECLVTATGGRVQQLTAPDPLMRPIETFFGHHEDTAFIEVAAASGFQLLHQTDRNPLFTTSYGTGVIIKHAIEMGFRKFIVGLGGSAVNDAGAGMLQALGISLIDHYGQEIRPGGFYLSGISKIITSGLIPGINESRFTIACDVSNPLTGTHGTSAVYGPQKGATPEMVKLLDDNLKHFGILMERESGRMVMEKPGAGAAGGIGAAIMAFLPAAFQSGFSTVSGFLRLDELCSQADYIVTGEGSLDRQTLYGKTVKGIYDLAVKYQKPIYILAGENNLPDPSPFPRAKILSISTVAGSKSEALSRPFYYLAETAKRILLSK